MFLQEARILERLRHPGLCRIEETGSVDGEPFIAMEVLQGTPLHKLLKRLFVSKNRLPVPLVQGILFSVAEALHYAHEEVDELGRPLGLVHRDVTPQNIFLTLSGEVKLLDFGVARIAEQTRVTQPGQLKGKWAYLSPEQILAEPLDRRADIFSVGIVGWECLTNRPLFQRSGHLETMAAIVQGRVPRLETIYPDLPYSLIQVVHRALERDPAARFATAQALAQALSAGLPSGPARAASLASYLARTHANEPSQEIAPTERSDGPDTENELAALSTGDFPRSADPTDPTPAQDTDLAEAPTVELGEIDTDALKALVRGWTVNAPMLSGPTVAANPGSDAQVELRLKSEPILPMRYGSSQELPVLKPAPLDDISLDRAAPTVRALAPEPRVLAPPPPGLSLTKIGIIFLLLALGGLGLVRFFLRANG